MPYQLGSAPPGLRGFLLSRQNQQAEAQNELRAMQGMLGLQGLLQKQQMAPLEMELLRAQIEEKRAAPQRAALEAQYKQTLIDKAQREGRQADFQQQALGGLSGLMATGGYMGNAENPVVSPPTAVMTDENAARQVAIDAYRRGDQNINVNVPNPALGRALALQADPKGGLLSKLYPQASQQGQRPTVLNPGAGLVPPGHTAPVYTQPHAPRAEPLVIVQGENGPQYVPRSQAQGKTPGARPSSTTREPMSEEAIRDLAVQSLYDSNVLAGYRRDTTAMARIADARIKVMKEAGVTSEDVVSGRAGFKADQTSLSKITPQYDAITAFEQTAIRNGKILIELANKVDQSGLPVIDKWIRAGRQATGDPDVAKFNAQLHLYRAEAARILTQPNLSGVLSDSARHEMEDFMRPGASAEQIKQTVQLLERDFINRKQTLEEQISNIRSRMRGRVAPGGASTPGIRASDEDLIKKYLNR